MFSLGIEKYEVTGVQAAMLAVDLFLVMWISESPVFVKIHHMHRFRWGGLGFVILQSPPMLSVVLQVWLHTIISFLVLTDHFRLYFLILLDTFHHYSVFLNVHPIFSTFFYWMLYLTYNFQNFLSSDFSYAEISGTSFLWKVMLQHRCIKILPVLCQLFVIIFS